MIVKIFLSRQDFTITFFGISAIIFMISLIFLTFLLMNALEPEDIEHRVRLILMRQISQQHMQDLKDKGLKIPDEQMANQWQEEINRTKKLDFLSLTAKNPIPDILSPDTPNFVVRVKIRDELNHVTTRYFWLSWSGIDREISKIAWYFSI